MGVEHAFKWAAFKFTSTVLDDIWPAVLFFSGFATMVVTVSKFTQTDLSINSITITVLGTIVSLVVSFKTNSSYSRWWDGRNVWCTITSNSRHLAMLLWLQVPNVAPPKDDDKKKDNDKDKKEETDDSASDRGLSPIKEEGKRFDVDREAKKAKLETEKQREVLQGLIEKKTYIGLIQAFAVAMKHALRGENGPFYSDLYSLIAFLPKYNPSVQAPICRDHLLTLWHNGIPRQKYYHDDGTCAVPLTQPATFNGRSFASIEDDRSSQSSYEIEENPTGLTTKSDEFRRQAINSAANFTRTDDPSVCAWSRLDHKHRLARGDKEKTPEGVEKVAITTVELMPPRHPPSIKPWDLFPPLRIYKIITDWFRTKKMKEQMEREKGGKRRRAGGVRTEVPQEILMYLSAYVTDLTNRGVLNTSFISPLLTAILELQKAMSDLDKLATTPIPSAYSFHLRLTVCLYLLFLPFQLQQYIGWVTIPATAIAAIIYLGFLEIGAQIEMPFAYDQSDLDLDKFVLKIAHQLAEVTAFPTAVPTAHVVLSDLNQPFLPTLSLSATQILGLPEPKPTPSADGFAAAFPDFKKDDDNDDADNKHDKGVSKGKSATGAAKVVPGAGTTDEEDKTPMLKSVRDIEMILMANWREISTETESFIGRHRDQLENRTGLEVAVLAM